MKMLSTLVVFLMISAFATHGQTSAQTKPANMPPKALIAGKSSGEMKKKEILNAKRLTCSDTKLTISEFMMDIERHEIMGKGNELNDEMRTAIGSAPAGTNLYIEHVVALDSAGNKVYLVPISIKIK